MSAAWPAYAAVELPANAIALSGGSRHMEAWQGMDDNDVKFYPWLPATWIGCVSDAAFRGSIWAGSDYCVEI